MQERVNVLLLGDNTNTHRLLQSFSENTSGSFIGPTSSTIFSDDKEYQITALPKIGEKLPPGPYHAAVVVCNLNDNEFKDDLDKWVGLLQTMRESKAFFEADGFNVYLVGDKQTQLNRYSNNANFLNAYKDFSHDVVDGKNHLAVHAFFQKIDASINNQIKNVALAEKQLDVLKDVPTTIATFWHARGSKLPGVNKPLTRGLTLASIRKSTRNTEASEDNNKEKLIKPPKHLAALQEALDTLYAQLKADGVSLDLSSLKPTDLTPKTIAAINKAFDACDHIVQNAIESKQKVSSKIKYSMWKRDPSLDVAYENLAAKFNAVNNAYKEATPEPVITPKLK